MSITNLTNYNMSNETLDVEAYLTLHLGDRYVTTTQLTFIKKILPLIHINFEKLYLKIFTKVSLTYSCYESSTDASTINDNVIS
jgi:hypothetical protein